MDPTIVAAVAAAAAGATVAAAWLYRRARLSEAESARLRQDLLTERISARRDMVTGLLNRRGFFEFGNALLADPARRPLAVVLMDADLDALRGADNTSEQIVADEVLAALGRRFADYSRGHVVARVGDNRFAALLRTCTTGTGSQYPHAQDLSVILAEPIWFGGYQVHVATSVAVANVEDPVDLGMAVRRAEASIRRSKQAQTVPIQRGHLVGALEQRRTDHRSAKGPVFYRSRVIARHYK